LHAFYRRDQAALVKQVAPDQPHLAEKLPELPHSGILLASDQAPDFVPLLGQVLSQIGTVLAGDASDQRSLTQCCLPNRATYVAAAYRHYAPLPATCPRRTDRHQRWINTYSSPC